jgi:CcmD family protein
MKSMTKVVSGLFLLVLALGAMTALGAQEMANLPQGTPLAEQSLRPYWHVFIAYAVAILAVLGWVISMARRLASLEARLGE